LGVVREVDRVDRAHGLTGDQHLVPGNELTAGLELQLVAVAITVAEQGHHDQHRTGKQRNDRHHARERVSVLAYFGARASIVLRHPGTRSFRSV
jgi:hypothetical protein